MFASGIKLSRKSLCSGHVRPRGAFYSSQYQGTVTAEQLLQYPSTPLNSPSYPKGPYFFQNREYFIVYYESDIESIKKVVPAPLVPKSNIVAYEWIKMPDSTGFGSYQESGTVIPCILNGRNINFTTQMFLNDEPPIAAGREIWGFPKKRADPEFSVHQDTIYGKLEYNGQTAAWGTMTYKHHEIPEADAIRSLTSTSVNLKIIPDVDLKPKICQLVGYNLILKKLHGAWKGSARLHLIPHANAPTADLPVRKVLYGAHYLADIILPYGEVLYDYLSPENINKTSPPSYAFPEEKVRDTLCMPPISPSYTPPPIVFKDREYFMILYRTKLEALRPLIPDLFTINKEGRVIVQWIFTKSHGIGAYTKFVVLVPVKDKRGKSFLFEVNEFSDSSAAITMGREVYGQPYKYAKPSISVNQDTVLGHLNFSGLDVAQGTMPYKESELDESIAMEFLSTPHVNIKLIPNVVGDPEIAQIVSATYTNIKIHSSFKGRGRLHLIPHANAPVSDLPVEEVETAFNVTCDLVLPPGKIEHDYLAK